MHTGALACRAPAARAPGAGGPPSSASEECDAAAGGGTRARGEPARGEPPRACRAAAPTPASPRPGGVPNAEGEWRGSRAVAPGVPGADARGDAPGAGYLGGVDQARASAPAPGDVPLPPACARSQPLLMQRLLLEPGV